MSSAVLIGLVLGCVFIDWLWGLLVIIFTALGLYEFFRMLENKKINIYKYFGIGMGILIPASILFRFELTKSWELLFVVLALLLLILMQFRRRDSSGAVLGISTTIFGIVYVSWFLSFFIKIRYLPLGINYLAALLIITKLGDIGAFLAGIRFGKTPLLPHVSPKKSVEGAIGGLIFSVLGAFASKAFLGFSNLELLFIGVFLGILGQLGDLSESLIKRDCQVKDSGHLIPGMGGVLDIIDSLLFTAPAFYFYISITLN